MRAKLKKIVALSLILVLKSGVIFTSRKGHLRDAPACDEIFGHICAAYNTRYPEHKLKVTPHICRHTYCSAIIQNGMRVAKKIFYAFL